MTEQAIPKMEIRVKGRVLLGDELKLEEITQTREQETAVVGLPIGSTLSPAEIRSLSPLPQENVKFETVEYELKPTGKPIQFEDQGLVLQYGVLGSPGSGKTHLLMHLLRQIIEHERKSQDRKFGGLILDPKAGLIDDVRKTFQVAGREEDLIVVNTRELWAMGGVNVIDCMLAPADLGAALVLAARSADLAASDPYWLQQMAKAFGAILTLMKALFRHEVPTVAGLMDFAVGSEKGGRPALEGLIKSAAETLHADESVHDEPVSSAARDLRNARAELDNIRKHAESDPRTRVGVEQFMDQAFAIFRASEYACYSAETPAGSKSLYDRIIDEGKFILVSMGVQEVKLSALLPALMKLIFQRTVLSRFDRYASWELHNCERPVLFMADEYHTIATQVPGLPGDSYFFSQARQPGGLCLVATQSVEQLIASPMKEAWKAVFDVLAAVIVMAGDDPATAEYIGKRAGNKEVIVTKRSPSIKEGREDVSVSYDRIERPVIPPGMRQRLKQGQAIVIGKTTGQKAQSSVQYLQVPPA